MHNYLSLRALKGRGSPPFIFSSISFLENKDSIADRHTQSGTGVILFPRDDKIEGANNWLEDLTIRYICNYPGFDVKITAIWQLFRMK